MLLNHFKDTNQLHLITFIEQNTICPVCVVHTIKHQTSMNKIINLSDFAVIKDIFCDKYIIFLQNLLHRPNGSDNIEEDMGNTGSCLTTFLRR